MSLLTQGKNWQPRWKVPAPRGADLTDVPEGGAREGREGGGRCDSGGRGVGEIVDPPLPTESIDVDDRAGEPLRPTAAEVSQGCGGVLPRGDGRAEASAAMFTIIYGERQCMWQWQGHTRRVDRHGQSQCFLKDRVRSSEGGTSGGS